MRRTTPEKSPQSVLIVCSNDKSTDFIRLTLNSSDYIPIETTANAGEAKRRLSEKDFDVVIINTPLKDEFGVDLAVDINEKYYCGTMLLVKNDIYEQIAYKTEDFGIFCVSKPITKEFFLRAVRLVSATRNRIKSIEIKTENLKEKMNEIRLVNRAKLLLIEKLSMTEKDAHRHIEKQAMDLCLKKSEIAKRIIITYES